MFAAAIVPPFICINLMSTWSFDFEDVRQTLKDTRLISVSVPQMQAGNLVCG